MTERASMTIEAFLEELELVSAQFHWMLIPDDGWPTERRAQVRFRIRGAPLVSRTAKHQAFNPLEAVSYARSGKRSANGPIDVETLGLTPTDREDLRAASNDRTQDGPPQHRRPDLHLVNLRRLLLAAVGLSVPESRQN